MKNIKPLAYFLSVTFIVSLTMGLGFSFNAATAVAAPHSSHHNKSHLQSAFVTADNPVDSCQKSCSIDADCGQGGFCNAGHCERKNTYCSNDRWSVNSRGETWNCNAYRCNETNGLCFRAATSNGNCTTGYVFDGKSSCIPSVSCAANDPSCQDLYARWLKARHDYENQTLAPQPSPFSCIPCTAHADCGADQMCWQNRCEKSDLYCAVAGNGESVVVNKQGIVASCQNFACDPVTKSCFTQCQAAQDCRSGKSCVGGVCL